MDLKETKLSSEPIYQGSFVTINRDKVRLPNGNESQRIVIRHPGAACVLAVTEEGKAVLVRQWRYAADAATLELPAGKLDAGEDPAECALRELAEETPYTADRVKLISSFYTAIGFCDEKMYFYQAEGVRLGSTLSNDEDEITETVLMSKEEARTALAHNEIKDGKTLIGLQYWLMQDWCEKSVKRSSEKQVARFQTTFLQTGCTAIPIKPTDFKSAIYSGLI